MATCYRHSNRETGVSCSNCGRPICPDCMTPTPVGMRCPECAKQKTKVRTVGNISGGEPRVTYVLIALCVIGFLGSGNLGVGSDGGNSLYERGVLFEFGIVNDELYRLVTYGFLHSGFIHIGFNMYLLYLLGTQLEQSLGSVRFSVLYFTSLLAGALGAVLQTGDPRSGVVGASGAVFGLMAATALEMRRKGYDPLRSDIGILIGLNFVLGFVIPNVSWGGHLGGFVGGALVITAFTATQQRRVPWLGYVAAAAIAAASVAGAIAVSQAGVNSFLGV